MHATTLQFRAIVRKVFDANRIKSRKSYTDKPVGEMHNTDKRYVGIEVCSDFEHHYPGVLAAINKELEARKFDTRARLGSYFLRGVCKAA